MVAHQNFNVSSCLYYVKKIKNHKMKNKIIITAANGFIGKALINYLKPNYEVIAVIRKNATPISGITNVIWDGKTVDIAWSKYLENALAVINLAGRSVDCRYNEKNKNDILQSRLLSTQAVADAIKQCVNPPSVWLNAASATIYKFSLGTPMTENNNEIGTGFSVDVCKQWEGKFYENKIKNVRQIAMRTTIVLGKNGGVMKPFTNLVKFGLGGKMGNGKQMFSWMHLTDFCRAVEFLIKKNDANGSYNFAAPNPVNNSYLMQAFRKQMHMSIGIPSPKWVLEIGARFLKTETELILKSRFVLPKKLEQEDFVFKFPTIEKAFEDLLN